MRASAATALVVAAALCGCVAPRDERVERSSLAPGGERWAAVVRTMTSPPSRDASNVCTRGDRRCVDAVAGEMRRRLTVLERACDHDAAFLHMYLTVTEGVLEQRDRFDHPRYMNHLDAVFAELYFRAFDAYRAGRPERVPAAWRVAFRAAERRYVSGLGDMLLGMNAHISRDLPYAVERTGLEVPGGRSGREDYDRVNGLLADVQQAMLETAAARLDPSIATFRLPVLGFSAADVADLMATWRDEAWRNARRLTAAATPAERAAVARSIDENAERRARVLEAATSYALVGGSTDSRDRYCAQVHAGGDPRRR